MILAIETSSNIMSLALAAANDGNNVIERNLMLPRGTMSEIIPAIDEMVGETGVKIENIGTVVAGLGPGSYTGLRIGVVIARTFAQLLGCRIIGIPSLDALALRARQALPDIPAQIVCPIVDAKRGELYYAWYCTSERIPKRLHPFQVVKPAVLADELAMEAFDGIIFTGDGVTLYKGIFAEVLKDIAWFYEAETTPKARDLIEVARERIARDDFDDIYTLSPIYVRVSQAEEMWEKRQGSARR